MMFPFLTPYEATLIQADYEHMLLGPDATKIDITYRSYLNNLLTPTIDPVYKNDTRSMGPPIILEGVPCMIQIVHQRNLQILSFGIVEAGDALFYFLQDLNLVEPLPGQPAIPDTMIFTEPQGGRWTPVQDDPGPLRRFLAMELGDQAIAQVVPCTLVK